MGYQGWALLSALFAGLTAVLAKVGVEGVPSNLALAVRTVVILAFAWVIAFTTNQVDFSQLTGRAWVFLALSGVATGASWLCYFRALQMGPVSAVAPIDKLGFVVAVALGFLVLREKVAWQVLAGCGLIVAGVLVTLQAPTK